MFYSREDRAQDVACMDSSLRQNLSGRAGGRVGQGNHLAVPVAGGNEPERQQQPDYANDTFESYLNNLVWNQVDGRYASMDERPRRWLSGAATYKDLGADLPQHQR